MSDTQVLLSKIAALRQRLEQVQGLGHGDTRGAEGGAESNERAGATHPRGGVAPSLANSATHAPRSRLAALEKRIATGAWHNTLLDATLRPIVDRPASAETPALPRQLTARARRLLEEGRDVLTKLRALADEPLLHPEGGHPLAQRYRATVAMADTALRMVQAYPDAASAQLRLCEGLEATLSVVAQRTVALADAVEQRRQESSRLEMLSDLLGSLVAGKPLDIQPFFALAEALLADAQQAAPLHFYRAEAQQPARFIAGHCLNVAQVAARLVKHDPELRNQPLEPVVAALVHDVGMLCVPVEVLAQKAPWNDIERRSVESHTRVGAELAARLLPGGGWLGEAAVGHHERIDGTGYPDGLREMQIAPLVRLLAVCDVYAALCVARPQRPALDPRTALTDTLLLAEKGKLDRQHAERLLQLSFYPVGSVVELADGSVGMVVASNMARRDLHTPARPVLVLLTSGEGQPLPAPRHVDLTQWEGAAIVRTLPPDERCQLLGKPYPEIA